MSYSWEFHSRFVGLLGEHDKRKSWAVISNEGYSTSQCLSAERIHTAVATSHFYYFNQLSLLPSPSMFSTILEYVYQQNYLIRPFQTM